MKPSALVIPNQPAARRQTHVVNISWKEHSVSVGAGVPVVVQSMTNTDTADALQTALQIKSLYLAGSELVRITVNNESAAQAVPYIRDQLDKMRIPVPLIGDFHYNGHILLEKYPDCASALSKYRINPGNVGSTRSKDENFSSLVAIAIKHSKAIRIGVNWGSLDQSLLAKMMDENAQADQALSSQQIMYQALIESAISNANKAVELGLPANKIILSCKVSQVQDLIAVYRELATRSQFPLHLGLTEAGMGTKGVVASTAALSVLLQEGIGDTIRVSLTPEPNGDRCQEVLVAQEILQSLNLRAFTPQVIACPGCGRTTSTVFQSLAQDIQTYLREQMPIWKTKFHGVEQMKVAVMGCVVNGPGESKHADIGISLPGTGEAPAAPVFLDGKHTKTLKGERIAQEFQDIVQRYVEQRYTKVNN